MKHTMKLRPNPFRMILCGEKTYELRLYDEKRQCIKIGDEIEFVNTKTDEPLVVSVKSIHIFKNFTELYQALPLLKCGYTEGNLTTANPADMENYYSKEQQVQYGVVAFEIEKIQNDNLLTEGLDRRKTDPGELLEFKKIYDLEEVN